MDIVNKIAESFAPWLAYLDYCLNEYPAATVCEPFWTRTLGMIIAIGVTAVAITVWKYLKYRRDYRAALRAHEDRMAVANASEMQANTWDGDKAYSADVPDDEVARRIREALEARRRGVDAPPGPRRS